jgi:hypothetical protein
VSSQEGRGTKVTILLPAASEAALTVRPGLKADVARALA